MTETRQRQIDPESLSRMNAEKVASLQDIFVNCMKGKVALVSGGASGLGYMVVSRLCEAGAKVVIASRGEARAQRAVEDFKAINAELEQYSPELAQRPMIVAGNKVDIAPDREGLEALKEHVEGLGLTFFEMSAAAHQGTRELMWAAARRLQELPPITVYEPTYVERPPEIDTQEELEIVVEDGEWFVDGPWLRQLMANVNFSDYESKNWFERKLRESGLYARLEEMGIQDGDILCLYNLEFEYQR